MPVCPATSPPPTWFLIPWPWQAPFNWGICAVMTYLFVVAAFIAVQPNVRRIPHPARRQLVATLLRTGYFVLGVGEFWLALVAMPFGSRISTWSGTAFQRYAGVTCYQSSFQPVWSKVNEQQTTVTGVGIGMLVLALMILVVAGRANA